MQSSYKQGTVFSVGFTAATKVFSFALSLMVAYHLGADAQTDIYFFLILIASVLGGWLQSININVIVPEFMYLRKKGAGEAVAFINFFLYAYAAGAALVIIFCALLPQSLLSAASHFDAGEIARNANLAGFAALYFVMSFMMTFLISLAESYKFFKIYFLMPLNSLLPFAFFCFSHTPQALFMGYTAAYIVQIALCIFMLRKYAGWNFKPVKFSFDKKFVQNFIFHQPSSLAWTALAYAPLFMLSAAQPGTLSALNYSRSLSDSLLDVFTFRVSNIAKVKITSEAAQGDFAQMADSLLRSNKILLFILTPICVFTSVFAFDIVKLFFMRGSFGMQDAENTAFFLRFIILSIPLIALGSTLNNFFAALRIIKEVAPRYAVFALTFTIIFIAAIKYHGAQSYPFVFLTLCFAGIVLDLKTVREFAAFLPYGKHLLYMIRIFALCFACAFAVKFFLAGAAGGGNVFMKILLNGGCFVILNAAVFYFTGDIKQFRKALNI
jgi:putative peptidoglycan lipid II flippase